MTVPELIANVLDNLRRNFYTAPDGFVRLREFKRDERQLIKAVSRYGHECNQRGWQFDCDFIHRELSQLLLKIRTSGADIQYLPVYLDGAVTRHIGTRAEELNAKAKALDNRVSSVLAQVRVGKAVTGAPSDVEIFSTVFKGINRIQKIRKKQRLGVKQQQENLL